jgi:hypothetical protein
MKLVTQAETAQKRKIQVNGKEYTLSEYVGAAPKHGQYVAGNETNDNGMPQGFLVHQPPNAITPAHFHEPNQFQVFIGGGGRIGAYPTTPLTVQYANGHTPYGPIVANEKGIEYFTLRQRWDPGAKYMPASRDLLRKGNQRARVKGGLDTPLSVDERAGLTEPRIETVFAPEADGLAGWFYRFGPNGSATLPLPSDAGGQYLIVTHGALEHEGASLAVRSTVYLTNEEPRITAVAGVESLDLLVLQFPRMAETKAA